MEIIGMGLDIRLWLAFLLNSPKLTKMTSRLTSTQNGQWGPHSQWRTANWVGPII